MFLVILNVGMVTTQGQSGEKRIEKEKKSQKNKIHLQQEIQN